MLFCKQKTAYEVRISDWSSDVCSSDLYALEWGMEAIQARVQGLADGLRGRLAEIPGVTITDLGAEKCGIVTFTKQGEDPMEIRDRCIAKGIDRKSVV